MDSVSSASGAPKDRPCIICKRDGETMTRMYQTGCLVFKHQTHRPRNLNEEAFDTKYQDRDQGRECVLHIGAESLFVSYSVGGKGEWPRRVSIKIVLEVS